MTSSGLRMLTTDSRRWTFRMEVRGIVSSTLASVSSPQRRVAAPDPWKSWTRRSRLVATSPETTVRSGKGKSPRTEITATWVRISMWLERSTLRNISSCVGSSGCCRRYRRQAISIASWLGRPVSARIRRASAVKLTMSYRRQSRIEGRPSMYRRVSSATLSRRSSG